MRWSLLDENGVSQDSAVAALYFANGMGLFLGMMIARRVGIYFEVKRRTIGFIGWSLVVQGIIYRVRRFDADTLVGVCGGDDLANSIVR